jgi:hypothetical protein
MLSSRQFCAVRRNPERRHLGSSVPCTPRPTPEAPPWRDLTFRVYSEHHLFLPSKSTQAGRGFTGIVSGGTSASGDCFSPVNTYQWMAWVHLPLFGAHRLEADGIVCHCDVRGAGIEFRGLSEEQSHHGYEFIADFTPGQMLAR